MIKPTEQSEGFKRTAPEPGTEVDEGRWERRLKRVARAKADAEEPPRDPIVRKKR